MADASQPAQADEQQGGCQHQDESEDQRKLLYDLASLHLSEGRVAEAQKLFKQLAAQQLGASVDVKTDGVAHTPAPEPPCPSDSLLRAASRTSAFPDFLLEAAASLGHQFQPATGTTSHTQQGTPDSVEDAPSRQGSSDEDDWEKKSLSDVPVFVAPKTDTSTTKAETSSRGQTSSAQRPLQRGHERSLSASGLNSMSFAAQRDVLRTGSTTQLNTLSADCDAPEAPLVTWDGGFDHCVEVYDLNKQIKTTHLQELLDRVLPDVRNSPFIRWADDNHAVFVCGSVADAQRLMDTVEATDEPYKLRPWSQASQQSKLLPMSELLPPKPRPKTTAAVAKKLLSHALGMPQLRDRQGERVLAQARKDAKQDRQARREAAAAAWGDDD